jgi:hypothetical protein
MPPVAIPNWNALGIIPPFDVASPTSADRSPYLATLPDLVTRFGTSSVRCSLLERFLRYRAFLHQSRLVSGFQWINGSFLADVETLESRTPNDIDVVTFYRLPPGQTQKSIVAQFPDLADRAKIKTDFMVDHYLVCLDGQSEFLIKRGAYWYSLWSHTRNAVWKGYIEIDLTPHDDTLAFAELQALDTTGGHP